MGLSRRGCANLAQISSLLRVGAVYRCDLRWFLLVDRNVIARLRRRRARVPRDGSQLG